MNKVAAKKMAEAETVSIGDLRNMITATRDRVGFSNVNPSLTLDVVCDIYWKALEGRSDDEVPKAWRPDIYSRRLGAVKPSRDVLIVTNILRDCA